MIPVLWGILPTALLIIRPDRPFIYQQIDRKLVSARNRIRQKGIVCQKQKRPLCCGLLRGGQNEEKAMTTPLGTNHEESPEVKAEKRNSDGRLREEEA